MFLSIGCINIYPSLHIFYCLTEMNLPIAMSNKGIEAPASEVPAPDPGWIQSSEAQSSRSKSPVNALRIDDMVMVDD